MIIYNFERQCYDVNEILIKKIIPLSHSKFMNVWKNSGTWSIEIQKKPKWKKATLVVCCWKIFRIWYCLISLFDIYWFDIIQNSNKEKKRQEFKPINIVFQPLKHYKQVINCYFSDMLHFVYIEQHIPKNKFKNTNAYKCFVFSGCFAKNDKKII